MTTFAGARHRPSQRSRRVFPSAERTVAGREPQVRNFNSLLFGTFSSALTPTEAETVYAILDNLAAHRHADVLLFSAHHPRWRFVFQPRHGPVFEPDRTVVEIAAVVGDSGARVRNVDPG